MQKTLFFYSLLLPFISIGQIDTSLSAAKANPPAKRHAREYSEQSNVFFSQKLINANTVEVLPKGIMEFRVSHTFGDIAGHDGGIKPFFGLENAFDVRIGVQAGLTNKLNVILARAKGGGTSGAPGQLYELGLKYQFMKQGENNSGHPFSLTLFANSVVSSMTANAFPGYENSFTKFSDRTSEVVQLMIARKFGKLSLQLNPTWLTRGYVINGDDKNLFAIGGALRLPISSKIIFIADYFHTFRSQQAKDAFGDSSLVPLKFYDALGVGFEILTAGHVFHLNFTNATDLLENRLLAHTFKSWEKGQFRWSFTLSRNFTIFRSKKN